MGLVWNPYEPLGLVWICQMKGIACNAVNEHCMMSIWGRFDLLKGGELYVYVRRHMHTWEMISP